MSCACTCIVIILLLVEFCKSSFKIQSLSVTTENELTFKAPKTVNNFANSVDPDEVAHHEPSYMDLHCLPCSYLSFQIQSLSVTTENELTLRHQKL